MRFTTAIKELEAMGTAQNRKVYTRHGVTRKMFGVSYANLGKLKKQIRTDAALAERLWKSKNHDARVLATMVADPTTLKSTQLDAWAKELSSYPETDAFSKMVSQSEHAHKKMSKWTKSKDEWTARAGWQLLAHLAHRGDVLTDKELESYVPVIESKIQKSANRTRDAMNSALIAVGMRGGRLEKRAIAAAKRIGKVEVDHGETSCKTPDAAEYIRRSAGRR